MYCTQTGHQIADYVRDSHDIADSLLFEQYVFTV